MSASANYGLFQLPKNGPKRRGADVVGRVGAIKTGLAELEPSLLNPHHFIPIYPSTNLLAGLANRAAAGGQRKVKPQKQVDRQHDRPTGVRAPGAVCGPRDLLCMKSPKEVRPGMCML